MMNRISEQDRLAIKQAIKQSEWKTQTNFAKDVLKIHNNSLARKLSNVRSFTELELTVIANVLGLTFNNID